MGRKWCQPCREGIGRIGHGSLGFWSHAVLRNWEVLWVGDWDLGSVGIGRGWDRLGC